MSVRFHMPGRSDTLFGGNSAVDIDVSSEIGSAWVPVRQGVEGPVFCPRLTTTAAGHHMVPAGGRER
nr:hypothetical protein GCM10017611_59130 [Rhodococcus wratislaviensis]